MAGRKKRDWHPNFIKYMNFIVNHPNYKDMPFLNKKNGGIRWFVTRGSEAGMARMKWWDRKRKELGIPKETAWISKTARAIHPTGEKPCQICGKKAKLDYVYPNKRGGKSPGAMSNAPDRLDGFHSYNKCCRSKHDTGRHKENLSRYGEDRRVYENWSDGDWKAASWLMQEYRKNNLSPDHIGPLSLGFAHRPKFQPMTSVENSAKNNRMTYQDVQLLLQDEASGESVVSSHSKFIWDKIKNLLEDDEDALILSKIMRTNLHYVLMMFSIIHKAGYDDFLIKHFLHSEYAAYSIEFKDFDPTDGTYAEMIKTSGSKKQYKNNEKRYIRKSIEALDNYDSVSNRNLSRTFRSGILHRKVDTLLKLLSRGKEKEAREELDEIFIFLSEIGYQNFIRSKK